MVKKRTPQEFEERQIDELEKKVKELDPSGKVILKRNLRGQEKMSEVLLEFLKPYLEGVEDRDTFQKLVVVGIVAWNAAILPEAEFQKTLGTILTPSSILDRISLKRFVNELIERKKKLFPDNQRLIMSYHISETDGNWHVSVASTLANEVD